jgi:hypothetical protein
LPAYKNNSASGLIVGGRHNKAIASKLNNKVPRPDDKSINSNGRPLFSFEMMHDDIHKYVVASYYDTESLFAVKTSRCLYRLYQPEEMKRIVKKLLYHVIQGEQVKVKKLLDIILKTRPKLFAKLLKTKIVVKDYSGRRIEGTAFQLALGARDAKFHDNRNACIVELLAHYLKMLPDGEVVLAQQYNEQFPNGWEQKEAQRATEDSTMLHQFFSVMSEASEESCQKVHLMDDTIQKLLHIVASDNHDPVRLNELYQTVLHADKNDFDNAFNALKDYLLEKKVVGNDQDFDFKVLKTIYHFRNHLESTTKDIIRSGKHFNAELLIEAVLLYQTHYQNFGNRNNSARNIICGRKLIGYIQRFLPACSAQAFCHGLYEIVQRQQELPRSLRFRYDNVIFFPLDSDLTSRLGFDFLATTVMFGWGCTQPYYDAQSPQFYKTYIEQTHEHCQVFSPRLIAEETLNKNATRCSQ